MGLAAALGIIAGGRLVGAGAILATVILAGGLIVLIVMLPGHPRLLSTALGVGVLIGGAAALVSGSPEPPPYAGNNRVFTTATVVTDPKQNARGFHAWVEWRDGAGVTRKSMMLAPAWPRYHRGDSVRIVANSNGGDARLLSTSSLVIERHGAAIEERRARLRAWFDRTVRDSIGGSEGALALGLLVGDDSALTKADTDAVRRAGLSHITAVSGWNTTLVVAAVGTLLLALGLRGPAWVGVELAALAGYVWLVGSEAPVIRAAIMGAWVIAARQLGRPAHGPTLLALAAAIMIVADPAASGTLSFQLSIIATGVLIVVVRHTAGWSGWQGIILTPLVATAAISLATIPALAVNTGMFSLVSVPANLLAGPLVPLAAAGSVAVAATAWLPVAQDAAAVLTWHLTHLILWIARFCAGIPGGVIEIQRGGGLSLRIALLALLTLAASMLPEGRFAAWQIGRWMGRDERSAAFITGGLGAAILAIVVLAAP